MWIARTCCLPPFRYRYRESNATIIAWPAHKTYPLKRRASSCRDDYVYAVCPFSAPFAENKAKYGAVMRFVCYLHQKKRGFTVFENGETSFAIWERIGWIYVRHFTKADIWSTKPWNRKIHGNVLTRCTSADILRMKRKGITTRRTPQGLGHLAGF